MSGCKEPVGRGGSYVAMEAQVSLPPERGLRGRQGRALTLGLEPHPAPRSQEHAKNRLWLLGSWA